MEIFFTWLIGSIIVGALGSNRQIGFWGAFFLSLILSPLIGLIFALTSKSNEDVHYRQQAIAQQQKQQELLQTMKKNTGSTADELAKLRRLLDDGTITQSEFETQKKRLLGN